MISLIAPTAVQNYFFFLLLERINTFCCTSRVGFYYAWNVANTYSFNENYTNDIPEYTYKTKPVVDNLSLNRLNPLKTAVNNSKTIIH